MQFGVVRAMERLAGEITPEAPEPGYDQSILHTGPMK